MIDGITLIVMALIHMKSTIMSNLLTKVLNFLIFANQMLLVLKSHLMIISLKSINQNSTLQQDAINITYSVIVIIEIAIVGVFTYFKVRPYRKKSVFWSFDNHK